MSVADNVGLPLTLLNQPSGVIRQRVHEVLQQVGLEEHAHAKPGQLSGGQCQRVAIARALVKNPALIIADEPTASLDTKTALQIMTLLKQLMAEKNTACLVATHDARLMPFSDRVLEVEQGQLNEQAQAEESNIKEGVMI
jgi:putative ABC transport system ATP-binding protein